MLRLPSARGPHSIRPWNQPTTLPSVKSSAHRAAGEAQRVLAGRSLDQLDQRELGFLERGLERGGHVLVEARDRRAGLARLAEQVDQLLRVKRSQDRLAVVPGHRGALGVVDEVV